jgi:hypothetical protein
MIGILDFFQPPGHPILFKNEPDVTVKLLKAVIPRRYIKSDAGLKFAQTYRTKRKWSRITFLQVIGAVYHTFKVDTMCQRKHVSGFMDQHLGAAPQQQFLVLAAA